MATYAIGDIQGCYAELQQLLEVLHFDPADDTLWFVGDLINRGPASVEVLRFVKSLGDNAIAVLGNHDLHTLAVANGHTRYAKNDNIDDVLNAPDREELLDWLRYRPLLHHDADLGFTMLHAGLPPQWDLSQAQSCAKEIEAVLQSPDHPDYLEHMYGNEPDLWDETLTGWNRLRFITNCFSRLRYCDADGRLALEEKLKPGNQPKGLIPWFQHPARLTAEHDIVFGHWSTLGLITSNGVYAIDTGCLWGGSLTALKLDNKEVFSIPCQASQQP